MNRAPISTKRRKVSKVSRAKDKTPKVGYRARQPSLFQSVHLQEEERPKFKEEWRKLSRRTHGGSLAQGQRKERRPLDKKKWTHLILKSSRATGARGLLRPKNQLFVTRTIERKARKFGITIRSYANVGTHIHFDLKFGRREDFQNFLRSITTLISRFVTGARKGKPFGKFWDALAYTRVVTTRKEELQLRGYIAANQIEAGVSQEARAKYLDEFNAWVDSLSPGHRSRSSSA